MVRYLSVSIKNDTAILAIARKNAKLTYCQILIYIYYQELLSRKLFIKTAKMNAQNLLWNENAKFNNCRKYQHYKVTEQNSKKQFCCSMYGRVKCFYM